MTARTPSADVKTFVTSDFRLQSGTVMPAVTIVYRTLGSRRRAGEHDPDSRRRAQDLWHRDRLRDTISDPEQIEAAIRDEATRWAMGFDANSLIILAKALCGFDVTAQFSKIRSKVLYVLSRTDRLFPPELATSVLLGLRTAEVDADYFLLDNEYSHSASGRGAHKWAPRLREFMESL